MVALNFPPKDRRLTAEQVARRVESALADAAVLREYGDELDALDGDPAKLARANEIYDAWREWLAHADPIYEAAEGVEGFDAGRLHDLYVERKVAEMVVRTTPDEHRREFDRLDAEHARAEAAGERSLPLDDVRERVAAWRRSTGVPKPKMRWTHRRVTPTRCLHIAEPM